MDERNNGFMQYYNPYQQQNMNPYQPPTYTSPLPMTPYQYYQKPVVPDPYDGFQTPTSSFFGKQNNPMMHYFQDKNGEVDFDKVFHTVNQLANTYQQVSPVFKNVGSILKVFQK
ncbi:YppG family protein [Gracilibacillus salinarum]|uniref:YppG family protein n=1 Tax=Gracilibacillus salinarum TaxID=2932255 RepID=A0ABY4GJA6_9BACI|nr:YppG family protein [Gracilibacillus salinarum]UOQ84269.1 YppG family protein [Gracilibacillus salinarum]